MKKIIFTMVGIAVLSLTAPSFAENVVINQGDQVQKLPGNATIVTNSGRGPSGVIIYNNDDSVLYRALGGPGWDARRYNNRRFNNAAPTDSVNSICGNTGNATERNRCVRDVIKQQDKLRDKYN